MNQPSKQLKAMTRKLFTARSGVVPVNRLHPRRDWMIGILIGIGIATSIVGWSGYIYVVNRDGGATELDTAIPNPTYQATLVNEALTIFATRANYFSAAATPPVIQDQIEVAELETATTTTATTATTTATTTTTTTTTETTVGEQNENTQTVPTEVPEELDQSSLNPMLSW